MSRVSALVACLSLALLVGCSSPNEPPEVSITAPSEADVHGPEVTFKADAKDPDGAIDSYEWTFGDGSTSDQANPTHTYAESGEYRVELTVTDEAGETAKDGITIQVQVGPQARASIRNPNNADDVLLQYMSGAAPLDVAFNGARSTSAPGTEITSYKWDFGDGTSATGADVSHTYTEPGRYQATLTIADSDSQTDEAEVVVQVEANKASRGSVKVNDTVVSYRRLDPPSSANSSRGRSLFYKYVIDGNATTLDEADIETVLRDILASAKGQADADWINVQLYDAVREGFMAPRDYAHFLGALTWNGDEPEGDRVQVNVNTAHLDGTALRVLGTKVEINQLSGDNAACGDLCRTYRMAKVNLYVQDEPICRSRLINTVRDLAQWQLSSRLHGYLITIYSRDIRDQLGHALGVRQRDGPELGNIPLALFENAPDSWDIQGETFWLQLSDDIPDC
ncbi:MAG: PKD domain-containing protein [Candidatus Bipolaricaulia bacterium]